MSDNPFDEESDRTVIRPIPGGGRATRASVPDPFASPPPPRGVTPREVTPRGVPAAAPPGPTPAIRAPAGAQGDAEPIVLGLNALVSAAAPLLALVARLARTYSQPNTIDLRERTLQQIRSFEREAQAGGIPRELVAKARYVLCASLDDVAQSTEWGRDGAWASRPLVAEFQEGVRGYEGIQSGVGFFRLLDDAKRSPGKDLPLLELMYLCLSLGFLGELRINQRPQAALDRVRQDLYTIISNQRQTPAAALSPHWEGEVAPYKPPRVALPGWVIGSAALALIGGVFIWLSTGLNAASDSVFDRMLSAPLDRLPLIVRANAVLPPPMPPAQQQVPEKLAVFLKAEIDQGLVSVLGDHARPVVRIRNRGLFTSGNATVSSAYVPLLERIGQALNAERGTVEVDGYTDNQPIRTVRFPSNYQLSTARAEAAAAVITRAMNEPGRVTAKGYADADPVSSNDTPEGRDDNRRIEVILRRQG